MRRHLLDTGSASDYAHGLKGVDVKVQQRKALGDVIGICPPVLGELWAGIELSTSPQKNRPKVIKAVASLRIWPYDKPAAEEYGRIFALLQRMGRPMQQIDIQIAAIALSLGNCTVVTKDSDFKAIPGLVVEDWSI